MAGMRLDSDSWRRYRGVFQELANEERTLLEGTRKDSALRAYSTYGDRPEILGISRAAPSAFVVVDKTEDPLVETRLIETGENEHGPFCLLKTPEFGVWTLSKGPNENFQARFQVMATRAALDLGSPPDAEPLDFWLHRLYFDLGKTGSDQLFAASAEGGIILNVCLASATFCARLEKRALEISVSAQTKGQRGQRKSENPEVAKRRALVNSNPNISASEMCQIFDREKAPLPAKWQEAGFKSWSRIYRIPMYRSKIAVLISKDKRNS